jgi:alkylated DNA repair dioxygenase AlkB
MTNSEDPLMPRGLRLIEDYISESVENELIQYINSRKWNTELARRVQHYGYKFPELYTMTSLVDCEPIPYIIMPVLQKLNNELNRNFDQIIINEYKRGQGINQHIDKVDLFGDTVVSLSLGSPTVMHFTSAESGEEMSIKLSRRSVLILQGDARYTWRHSIKGKNNDDGVPRETRISITFRTKSDDLNNICN